MVRVGRIRAGGLKFARLKLQPKGAFGSGIRFEFKIASAFLSTPELFDTDGLCRDFQLN